MQINNFFKLVVVLVLYSIWQLSANAPERVKLYYYNPELDRDESDNIACGRKGLAPVEKKIPITNTPIQDAINLLLKGKENLTQTDKTQGITTEYPLEGLALKKSLVKRWSFNA
ncbi:hypothetical protein KKG29_02630 [Patescibacteria group bacterium]|nr:hypothetical protein [Patescibacteria group bacterium]MBU4368298.1 hypothetical protein [Patescibacteria group bacterium]